MSLKVINMNNSVSFELLASLLHKAGSYINAAEVHGLQCGMICGEEASQEFNYEEIIIRELNCLKVSEELIAYLNKLYSHSIYQLQGLGFKFDLLLPNDDANIKEKAEALADWSRGFLCGLGLAGAQEKSIMSKIGKEAIYDLSQIAHIAVEQDDDEIPEKQEKAFIELVEYVKVAVQTVHIDLRVSKNNHAMEYVFH